MNKIFMLLLALVAVMLPLYADNGATQSTQADQFVTNATNFGEKTVYGSTKVKNLVPDYHGAVQAVASQQPWNTHTDTEGNTTKTSAIDPKYDSTQYWSMVNNIWSNMMGKFTDNGKYPAPNNDLRREYAEKTAELSKEFLKDMVYKDAEAQKLLDVSNGSQALVNLYRSDFENLNQQYEDHLKLLNANDQNAAGSKQWFDPYTMLDQAASETSRKKWGVRAELVYAGANDKYLNYNILQLVNRIKDVYAARGYNQLSKDLEWFLKVWGQASELNVMATNDFAPAGSAKMRAVNASYAIDEYGKPNAERSQDDKNKNTASENNPGGYLGLGGTTKDPVTGEEILGSLTKYALPDASYNNRSYGYYNGNFTTITVTVANRQYQLYDHLYTSPIVLDMDGDGKLEASNGEWLPHSYKNSRLAEFDINGDGFIELTEWVGPNDGLLIAYKKGEEVNAKSLFGDADGYSDGFEKLSLLDVNNDKQLSGEELKTLSVWQDKNGNAQIEEGELAAVADLGITSISLNQEGMVSSFVQNGTTKKLWDWFPSYFRVKKMK